MATATSTDTRYVTTVQAEGFEITTDSEFNGVGGTAGIKPHDLLDASLASCIAMTIRMAADGRGTQLTGVTVEVTHDDDDPLSAHFYCTVSLEGDLTAKERAGLLRVAHHCPVSKLLSKSIDIGITEKAI